MTIVLIVAIPTLKELGRAARSAEKLFDTLRREFPPTLEAIRLTGMEITDLTDDLSEGVQSAGQVVKQVDQSLSGARKQAKKVQLGTRSLFTGVKTAWKTFMRSPASPRRSTERLQASNTSGARLESSEERLPIRPSPRAAVEETTYPSELNDGSHSAPVLAAENIAKSHYAEEPQSKRSDSDVTQDPRYLADDI
ncbi:DUF948 domain-containing protein [Phormidium sp. CLA17]|uniref:DUF948 domain-containing protein n=1 Tax=Leptolyngbya sp. Cla-17 TaxID=2803751 RepID=UPI001932DB35|nr:DUF948 domain-containing protein [Leptolyngbya sp. Cla-17]MBM0743282.1 DUF948 domain-containing protein [Leptolyngbya sp. Cla-17]